MGQYNWVTISKYLKSHNHDSVTQVSLKKWDIFHQNIQLYHNSDTRGNFPLSSEGEAKHILSIRDPQNLKPSN